MKHNEFKIGSKLVGESHPTYFIADISANHDGDLERAKALIHMAAESGADAAKFQNFKASGIVSDKGFKSLGSQSSHQAKWKKSVFEVYKDASIPWEWTPILKAECDKAGIEYFSTPYDMGAVDMLDPYVKAYKIGSGDITWPEICLHMASKGKPVLLATGAADMDDVKRIMSAVESVTHAIGLMQCNTNYTGSIENFKYIHLRVLETYKKNFPNAVLGLSDHTSGHATVLGAVTLGARLIEKHFTDDVNREGPDHGFSMTPLTWSDMVQRTRELEFSLGSFEKKIEANEADTVVLQRRCIRAAANLQAGTIIRREDLEVLRPAPKGSMSPFEIQKLIGRKLARSLAQHDVISVDYLE
jgi:N-acetylneuraminate synthase